jgi:predicted component of type VI protein secretion system
MRLRRRGTGETRAVRDGMVFGRLPSCEWPVDDSSVSRRHARVVQDAGGWFLEDLGSSNGTLLNGVRVPRLALRGGDLVTLGSVAFDVLADEETSTQHAATAPPPAAAITEPTATTGGAAAQDAERARARLHADLRRRDRSRGFGDLAQQSPGVRLLALLLGLAVLAGVAWGVRALGAVL